MTDLYIQDLESYEYINNIRDLVDGKTYKIRALVIGTGKILNNEVIPMIELDTNISNLIKPEYIVRAVLDDKNMGNICDKSVVEFCGKLYIKELGHTGSNSVTEYTFLINDKHTTALFRELTEDYIRRLI